MKITTINLTEEKIQKLGDVFNTLSEGDAYLTENIYPELKCISKNLIDYALLKEYAKGSYLAHNLEIQARKITRHYYIARKGNFFAIAETHNEFCGFLVDINGFAQFCALDKVGFKRKLVKNSWYIGKTFGEIVDIFCIPPAVSVPLCICKNRMCVCRNRK